MEVLGLEYPRSVLQNIQFEWPELKVRIVTRTATTSRDFIACENMKQTIQNLFEPTHFCP